MGPRLLTVTVLLLVVSAGCIVPGGSGDGDNGDTAPTEVETDDEDTVNGDSAGESDSPENGVSTVDGDIAYQQPTYTPASDLEPVSSMETLPPGVTASGPTDGSVLIANHTDALEDERFRLDVRTINRSGDDWVFYTKNDTVRSMLALEVPDSDTTYRSYAGPMQAGQYNGSSGEIGYARGESRLRSDIRVGILILPYVSYRYVGIGEWEPVGVDTSPNEDLLIMEATGANRSSLSVSTDTGLFNESTEVKSVDGQIAVDSTGRIRYANVTYDIIPPMGTDRTVGVRFTTTLGDVSVSEPAWLSEPPQLRELAVENERRLLVVEHTGGATIDAGTQLNISTGFSVEWSSTIETPVTEGDTIYMYKTSGDEDSTLHVSVDKRPTLPADATAFPTEILSIGGTTGKYEFQVAVTVGESDGE